MRLRITKLLRSGTYYNNATNYWLEYTSPFDHCTPLVMLSNSLEVSFYTGNQLIRRSLLYWFVV